MRERSPPICRESRVDHRRDAYEYDWAAGRSSYGATSRSSYYYTIILVTRVAHGVSVLGTVAGRYGPVISIGDTHCYADPMNLMNWVSYR